MTTTTTAPTHGVYQNNVVETKFNENSEPSERVILRVLVRDGGEPGLNAVEAVKAAGYSDDRSILIASGTQANAISKLRKVIGKDTPVVVSANVATSIVFAEDDE